MPKFMQSFRKEKTGCPKCRGEGFIKGRKCPRCNGLGQIDLRPAKNGRIVVGGMILVLFVLFCLSKIFTKPAEAAEPPAVTVLVEIIGPSATEEIEDTCDVTPTYPEGVMQWCALITAAANEHGMPSDLIAAVMLQESGGDESAYSSSGAVGLMQVMPRDGIAASFQCINGPCFAGRPTIEELGDPEFNIDYGTSMLAGLQARLGSLREALKAYGPMDVGYRYADNVLAIFESYQK